ncbi:MAG: hypothetical protein ABI771_06145 [Betaproteobacteria bacterium]
MKRNLLWCMVLTACVSTPAFVFAEKLDPAKNWEVGNKATYKITDRSKSWELEEELTSITGTDYVGVMKMGAKSYEHVTGKDGVLRKGIYGSKPEQSVFDPGLKYVDVPLEVGKKWTTFTVATGESFRTQVTQDRAVEKIEKVTTAVGEFDAFKVTFSGRLQGINARKIAYTGKEEGSEWYIVGVDGKTYLVKSEYSNSFGAQYTKEMVSVTYKK